MKKGFTMIELIFVIVILGILASVAVPRLAATREDAEISATVANLRTLISDASAYYVANGFFSDGKTTANWRDITNVPLRLKAGTVVESNTATGTETYLSASGKNCIKIEVKDRDRFFEVENCDRCGKPLNGCRIQSMYNHDVLCMDCKDKETQREDYSKAVEADHAEIKRGNYNFAGIGLKKR